MLDTLLKMDQFLLLTLNGGLPGGFFEVFMVLLSEKLLWLGVYLGALGWAYWRKQPHLVFTLLGLAIAVGVSDWLCAYLLKPYFGRLRPCHELRQLIEFRGCGGLYSFPSNHAANGMAGAAFLMVHGYSKAARYLFVAVLFVALSRVYLGVHFPADVFFGMYVGLFISVCLGMLMRKQILKVSQKSRLRNLA